MHGLIVKNRIKVRGYEQEINEFCAFVYISGDILMCFSHSPLVRASNICLTSSPIYTRAFSSFIEIACSDHLVFADFHRLFTHQNIKQIGLCVKQTEKRHLYKQYASLVQKTNKFSDLVSPIFVAVEDLVTQLADKSYLGKWMGWKRIAWAVAGKCDCNHHSI